MELPTVLPSIFNWALHGHGDGVPSGSPFATGGGSSDQRPSRDYDFDATAEEVPVNGDSSERRLPRTDAE